MSANPKTVCVPCRRVYKGEGRINTMEAKASNMKGRPKFPRRWMGTGAAMQVAPQKCPECGERTVAVTHMWRPPKRRNDRAWKRIERGDWRTEKSPHEGDVDAYDLWVCTAHSTSERSPLFHVGSPCEWTTKRRTWT